MPDLIPFTSLNRPLSFSESSGDLAVALDMVPARRHILPRDWPSPLLRFMYPGPQTKRPTPSNRRPAPKAEPPLPAA